MILSVATDKVPSRRTEGDTRVRLFKAWLFKNSSV